jgi:hypothetical protein
VLRPLEVCESLAEEWLSTSEFNIPKKLKEVAIYNTVEYSSFSTRCLDFFDFGKGSTPRDLANGIVIRTIFIL